jgi:putative methyltransferase (TIGR04325 family)
MTFSPGLTWTICEVPAVVRRGRELALSKGVRELNFTTDTAEANSADIFLASGSLQFIETSVWNLIEHLDSMPRHLLLNRVPLYDAPSFVTLHNMGKAICACQIWNEVEFIDRIQSLNCVLRDKWEVPEFSYRIPFHPNRSVKHYEGLYFDLAS